MLAEDTGGQGWAGKDDESRPPSTGIPSAFSREQNLETTN